MTEKRTQTQFSAIVDGDGDVAGVTNNRLDTNAVISGTVTVSPGVEIAQEYSSYAPDPSSYPLTESVVSMDIADQTMIRGQVLSDEGSFRDDFTGSSLLRNLTSNIQWNNNTTDLTGTGGNSFTTEAKFGQYVRRSADGELALTQIDYIVDSTHLFLTQNYLGSNGTTTGVITDWKTTTPAGGSISVASSIVSILPSTASGNFAALVRQGDYLPYTLQAKLAISQRVANQTAVFGFQDNEVTPTKQACFVFDGTNNAQVKCRTSSSVAASDITETTITLPGGATTNNYNTYEIDLTGNQASFVVNGVIVAVHNDHLPGPYDPLIIVSSIKNTAIVTATTLSLDWLYFSNVDQIEITSNFKGEPARVQMQAKNSAGIVEDVVIDEPTYSTSIIGLTAASAATDIFTITGSATKTIKVKKISITGTQTTAGANNIVLLKRSTANSAGTATTPAIVPHDSNSAAATAVVRAYTANPTAGALVGNVRATKMLVPTITGAEAPVEFTFGLEETQSLRLRGTGEVLALNLNGQTLLGNSFDIFIEWTEA